MAQLQFLVLGPLEAGVAGHPVRLGGSRRRALLAALLLETGQAVPVDRLARTVWEDRRPTSVRTQISIHVAALRKAVKAAGGDPGVIVTEPHGYRLDAEGVRVDAHEAERRIAEGRELAAAGQPDQAADLLGQALALWRGPVLAGLDTTAITAWARRLDAVRLTAVEEWAGLELACGRPREVVEQLTGLVDDHPLYEGLREKLVLALSHAGRQADALACYHRGRDLLLQELGLEPGPGLRQAQHKVLRGHPAPPTHLPRPAPARQAQPPYRPPATQTELAWREQPPHDQPQAKPAQPTQPPHNRQPTEPAWREGAPYGRLLAHPTGAVWPACDLPQGAVVRPAQLPPPVRGFVGRAPELRALDRLLAQEGPRVAVVSGMAGVGKTALVLRWAHQMAGRFPDGQLFADLRGYDAGGEPVPPGSVLERFLRALGVGVPRNPAEQAAAFREALAGRRALVVLDDAGSAEQVRPLLVDAPGCRMIITARRRLGETALTVPISTPVDTPVPAAAPAAVPVATADPAPVPIDVPVDVLPVPECVELVGRVAGSRRVADEREAAERLAGLCGGLPLAVRIAAAKLARQPRWPLSGLVGLLADERHRLDELVCDGLSVRDSIALSYRELPPEAARLFDRLGLVEQPAGFGPDLPGVREQDDRTGARPGNAAELLRQLAHAQLLRPPGGPSRPHYRFHELVRLFARERAATAVR
ncbi:AfsR/SARP family transcriptional regulator [Nonomuraea harbinensis]|uniref:BTAD domain-containing putative transcriptional regulator n=1 Tax=Nonomuraea harbinensis TaxID=1286938 RepID=A0ABW1C7B4_9ACTN|nr:AfsR/SARP family transcriptional regulator [Nonomuraea harbinensis]